MCLAIHCHFTVNQNKGKKIEVGVMFKDANGNWLQDINNRYSDSDGCVWVTSTSKCHYNDSEWKNYTIYIPNKEIHCRKGSNKITAVVFIYAKGKWHKSKICPSFTKYEKEDYVRCSTCKGNGVRKCWRCDGAGRVENLGVSKFYPYNLVTTYNTCDICKGEKNISCSTCSGAGIISKGTNKPKSTLPSSGYYTPPSSSYQPEPKKEEKRRTVTCTWCNGTGLVLSNVSCPISWIKDCVDVYCKQCATTHCQDNTNHKECDACRGTGKLSQILIDGKWYNDYSQ